MPNSRGKVWMPTSPTRKPLSMVLIAISAPMNGLVELQLELVDHLAFTDQPDRS